MFFHNFKYAFITLFRNRMLIFWTFAFPIILGTFFYMAFSDIENSEKLDIIDIAIVENSYFDSNSVWKEFFDSLSKEDSKNQLFTIQYVNEKDANILLEDGKIAGYIIPDENTKIVVKESGINETILKYVTEEIVQNESMIQNIVRYKLSNFANENNTLNEFYENIYNEVLKMQTKNQSNIKNISSNHLSYTMIEYYTLIAMACLYGGILGMIAINQNLANMSHKGKRLAVSPFSKKNLILSSVLASYFIQLIGIFLLFLYTIFILKVDYGSNFWLIFLLALAGSFAGLSLGIAIASLLKTNENTKTGIVIAITMLWCFLSGMMGITMKYIVDKNLPIINKVNPASMITDGFYLLYYYDTLDRYYFNVISLLIFAFVMLIFSIFSLRRQKYDSI